MWAWYLKKRGSNNIRGTLQKVPRKLIPLSVPLYKVTRNFPYHVYRLRRQCWKSGTLNRPRYRWEKKRDTGKDTIQNIKNSFQFLVNFCFVLNLWMLRTWMLCNLCNLLPIYAFCMATRLRIIENNQLNIKKRGSPKSWLLCQKCAKTHLRASVVPKKFLGSLPLAMKRIGKGQTEGKRRGRREGLPMCSDKFSLQQALLAL